MLNFVGDRYYLLFFMHMVLLPQAFAISFHTADNFEKLSTRHTSFFACPERFEIRCTGLKSDCYHYIRAQRSKGPDFCLCVHSTTFFFIADQISINLNLSFINKNK